MHYTLKKVLMIKKSLKSFLIILAATLSSYFGFADTIDPAVIISHTNQVKDKVISEIENENNEKIILKAGDEKFGLDHILKRHSDSFFTDSPNKGILFPSGTSGKQIIKGIEKVFKYGVPDPKAYGNKKVFYHELELNGEKSKYRLVLNEQNEVITFYKLKQCF